MNEYEDDNIFAKILRGEIPSTKIFENEDILVFMDVMPASKGHCLVVPKTPSRNLLDADPKTLANLMPIIQKTAKATKKALNADGIIIKQFNETSAGQTVFHLHFHVIPTYEGKKLIHHASKMADPQELTEIAKLIAKNMS